MQFSILRAKVHLVNQRRSQGDGDKTGLGWAPLCQVGPSQKCKLVVFDHLIFEGSLSGLAWVLLSLGWAHWGLKLAPAGPA